MNSEYLLLLFVFFVNKNQICLSNFEKNETAKIPGLTFETEEAEKNCQECPSSDGYFQSPSDCGSGNFFYCSQGKIVHNFECAGSFNTTVFNPESTICDRPENVKCDTKNRTLTIENESSSCLNHSESSIPKLSNKIDIDTDPMEDFGRDDYKIVCYLTSKAFHRTGIAEYILENTNAKYCTHINYAYCRIDASTLTIQSLDYMSDIKNGFLRRVTGLKRLNPKLKVLLSLLDWSSSDTAMYVGFISNPKARKVFISNVIEFLDKFGFDGLDLCWRDLDLRIVEELRQAFTQKRWLLTAAVSPNQIFIQSYYDVPSLASDLDFINVMAFDLRGSEDQFAAHHAPLDSRKVTELFDHNDIYLNVNYSVNYWISEGMPKKKIVLGVPFFGKSFTLSDQASSFELEGYGALAHGNGEPGRWTKQPGLLSFFEICENLKNEEWTKSRDPNTGLPFAYKGNQWVGYDDSEQVRKKTDYIKSIGIGGAMVWSLDFDDFNGQCCSTKWPLLKTLNAGLRGVISYVVDDLQCTRPRLASDNDANTMNSSLPSSTRFPEGKN